MDAIRQIGVSENKESASDLGKMFEYRLLKTQLTRVAIYLAPSDGDTEKINNKKCMLHLLCSMLKLMQPDKVETQFRIVVRQRRAILQNLMASVGILTLAL